MTRRWRKCVTLLSTIVMAGAIHGFAASPASAAECVGSSDGVLLACGGLTDQGYPAVILSVFSPDDSHTLLVVKTWVQDGDVPRTLSVGASAAGESITVGVDLSGDPGRTSVCVTQSDQIEPQCVLVSDLIDPPPTP